MTGDLDDKHYPPDYGKSRAALVPSLERRKEVLRLWDDQYPRLDRTSPENISGFWPLIAALDALAESRARAELAKAIFDADARWRCFHCDEVFTSPTDARLHFGGSSADEPACQIKAAGEHALLKALRAAYAKLAEFNREESDMTIAMQSAEDDHRRALKEAEQLGFDRGMESSRAEVEAMRDRAAQVCDKMCDEATWTESDLLIEARMKIRALPIKGDAR